MSLEAKLDTHLQWLNQKPAGEYIQVFASDYLKEYWSFYVHVSLDDYDEVEDGRKRAEA